MSTRADHNKQCRKHRSQYECGHVPRVASVACSCVCVSVCVLSHPSCPRRWKRCGDEYTDWAWNVTLETQAHKHKHKHRHRKGHTHRRVRWTTQQHRKGHTHIRSTASTINKQTTRCMRVGQSITVVRVFVCVDCSSVLHMSVSVRATLCSPYDTLSLPWMLPRIWQPPPVVALVASVLVWLPRACKTSHR